MVPKSPAPPKRLKIPQIRKIQHVAVVVADMDRALSFWRDCLGLPVGELRDVPEQKTQVAFLPTQGGQIELVKPTTDDSGVARFLARRGAGMHHVCLEVEDIEAMLAHLKARGVRLIDEVPRLSEAGGRYAFVHPEATGGVLLELYEAG
jgi:methylmalonyl-CoA/ethylmalonyl-CoA epimerase